MIALLLITLDTSFCIPVSAIHSDAIAGEASVPVILTISFPIAPSPAKISIGEAINVTETNNVQYSLTAVTFTAAQNAKGQTVEISTSTTTIASNSTTTAYPIFLSLQNNSNYTVTVFVLSSSGVPISVPIEMNITAGIY